MLCSVEAGRRIKEASCHKFENGEGGQRPKIVGARIHLPFIAALKGEANIFPGGVGTGLSASCFGSGAQVVPLKTLTAAYLDTTNQEPRYRGGGGGAFIYQGCPQAKSCISGFGCNKLRRYWRPNFFRCH